MPVQVKSEADLDVAIDEEETEASQASASLLDRSLRSQVSASSSASWYLVGDMAKTFAAFGTSQALLPNMEGSFDADTDSAGEPWVKSDIALHEAISVLATKLDELHRLTYTALKQHATAYL